MSDLADLIGDDTCSVNQWDHKLQFWVLFMFQIAKNWRNLPYDFSPLRPITLGAFVVQKLKLAMNGKAADLINSSATFLDQQKDASTVSIGIEEALSTSTPLPATIKLPDQTPTIRKENALQQTAATTSVPASFNHRSPARRAETSQCQ